MKSTLLSLLFLFTFATAQQVFIDAQPYAFLNQQVNPDVIRPYIPDCLQLDLLNNGKAVVSYTVENNTILGFHVPEIGRRTYVKYINSTTGEVVKAGYNFFYEFGHPVVCSISQAQVFPYFGIGCITADVNSCDVCTQYNFEVLQPSNITFDVSIEKKGTINKNNRLAKLVLEERAIEFSWNGTHLFPVAHPNVDFYESYRGKIQHFESNLSSVRTNGLIPDATEQNLKPYGSVIWSHKSDFPVTLPPITCSQL